MIYSKVRKYLKERILEVDSDFEEHGDAFNTDNIANSNLEKAFHIFYSVPTIDKENVTITSNIEAEIKFYFKGHRYPTDALDEGMDLVNEVAVTAGSVDQLAAFRMTDDFPIQACDPISQLAEPFENNDNLIIITLTMDMSVLQTLC